MFWIRAISLLAVVGLFIADFGFDAMAKNPPVWAYAIPGLLALGIEVKALQRLAVQALQAFARIPSEDDKNERGEGQ
ncbi:hypothetical protein [Roseobacter sp. CCS2]|uniref:hypothetical protein n=1 Tax=Roseobacter sp. CCS2 TaxID=391593 RepID=UPI0000F3C407|nr:hypothetical protein [Roseobacter sp. CCS2]EBA11800.1 hypothetical protein RCCS2_17766 [Roseobacter sp. CCS2]